MTGESIKAGGEYSGDSFRSTAIFVNFCGSAGGVFCRETGLEARATETAHLGHGASTIRIQTPAARRSASRKMFRIQAADVPIFPSEIVNRLSLQLVTPMTAGEILVWTARNNADPVLFQASVP